MKSIYLVTHLYNHEDKIRTCKLEEFLLSHFDITVYMPFRDTKEENISKKDWKKEIFLQDIAAIDRCDIVLGYVDFVFDEGIGFEIGYALTKGKQIILLNSDFTTFSIFDKPKKICDPLFEFFGIEIISGDHNLDYDNFHASLEQKREALLHKISFGTIDKTNWVIPKDTVEFETFFELGNSRLLYAVLEDKNISKRLIEWDAQDDIERLMRSKKVYIMLDGHQMHFGSSILCGICYGYQKPFYLVNNRVIALVGKDVMQANLMIDFACDGYIEIEEFLKNNVASF